MSLRIEPGEVEFHPLTVDACGRLFTWRERLFRAIAPAAAESVAGMFRCGMLDELIGKRLLVGSRMTDYVLDGYALVIEHDRVSPVVYPYEWSFSMLKDAALAVLAVNEVARRYGYQTRDCHGYNVCFDGTVPLFVDLGSFERVDPQCEGWSAYEEFLSFYEYPLRIWSLGNYYFARRALLGCGLNDMMSHASYFLYRAPWLRFLPRRHLGLLLRCWVHGRAVSPSPRKLVAFLRQTDLRDLAPRDLLRLQAIDFGSLAKRIRRIRPGRVATEWGDYQRDYYDERGDPRPHARFERIAQILKSYEVRTVLELAGNQGALSLRLAEHDGFDRIICTDRDDNAVEALYARAKARRAKIVPAVLDFMFPMTNYLNNRPPFERFRADAVAALAVTHHLLLEQRLSVDYILANVAAYARRYALVEFMPLGLHSPGRRVEVPPWYTLGWFRESFARFFRPLAEEILEENRVLFVGEVAGTPGARSR